MSILGNRVRRTEDPKFLTSGGVYTAEVEDPLLDGVVAVTFVRSQVASGKVLSIDTSAASDAPGVLGVFTAADLAADAALGPCPVMPPIFRREFYRPWLATDIVRFVGEPLAIVVTETVAQGVDAAEMVWADIDFQTPVVDPLEALMDQQLLFAEAGTNVANRLGPDELDSSIFDECDVVVRQRIHHRRVAACPLEGRAAAAAWDGDRLVTWLSSQNVHGAHSAIAKVYGLHGDQVRVIAPDVGGGFGPKINPYAEECLLGWIARRVGRPARWIEGRTENMQTMGHGRGHVHDVVIGGTAEGDIQAYQIDIVADIGAYPSLGGFLPTFTRRMASGCYAIPVVQSRARAVVTNTMSTVAYRGAGRPEATLSIERAIDLFAAEAGLDPIVVRQRNFIPSDAFPYQTATGEVYDTGDYAESLMRALRAADIDDLRREQAERRASGSVVELGIGIGAYVEITAGPMAGSEFAEIRIDADGTATVYTGTSPHGQGHHTSWAMIASEITGIPMDQITVIHGDTAQVSQGGGTMGSRSLQLGGVAVHGAAQALVVRARQLAASLLEVGPDEVELDTESGCFRGRNEPAITKSWAEIAAAAGAEGLSESHIFEATTPTYPFGAHVAVVEVDTETGAVRLLRHISCDDAGRIINPLIVEGQRHGGIAQGVAQALLEVFEYDSDGNPLTSNFADYGFISAMELPSFELIDMETPTPANPLGSKGIGESGTIGATPAVQNAVVDALSTRGVRHVDLPVTAERVWLAIQDASSETPTGRPA